MTVPGDVVLLRRPGVIIAVTAICAYPVGFAFYLAAGFDLGQAGEPVPFQFRLRTAAERASATRLQVGFPDGRVTDSAASQIGPPSPAGPVLEFAGEGGGRDGGYLRHESRWWVSPLPPAGPVDIAVYLRVRPSPAGPGASTRG